MNTQRSTLYPAFPELLWCLSLLLSTTLFADPKPTGFKAKVKVALISHSGTGFQELNQQFKSGVDQALAVLREQKILETDQIEVLTLETAPTLAAIEEGAEKAFQKMGADIVIGGYTNSMSTVLAQVAERRKKLAFLLAGSPSDIKERFEHAVSFAVFEQDEATALAEFSANQLKRGAAAIVQSGLNPHSAQLFAKTFESEFNKRGGQVRLTLDIQNTPDAIRRGLDQIRVAAPQIIICYCSATSAAAIMNTESQMGLRYPVLGTSKLWTKELTKLTDEKSYKGHYFSILAPALPNEKGTSHNDLYVEGGTVIQRIAHDAMLLVGDAIARSPNALPSSITRSLASGKTITYGGNQVRFLLATRSAGRDLAIVKTVTSGNLELVSRLNLATANP